MIKNGTVESGENLCTEWCVARYPKHGEEISGDLFYIKADRNQVLVAVVDGLGHGQDAFMASKEAVEALKSFTGQSLISLIHDCHETLKPTRGVVMSLALLDCDEQKLTWIGVGNVEGILFRARKTELKKTDTIVSSRGIVGYNLPALETSVVSIEPGDTLIFTTDGVGFDFEDKINSDMSAEAIVSCIASNHVDHSDDALVLAARFNG